MGEIYNSFDNKPLTKEGDIGKGQISIPHVAPPFFLEMQLIKLHNHEGANSVQLKSKATPEVIKGYRPSQREEHGTATWTGGAASSGSVVITFGTAFASAPTVLTIPADGDVNIQTAVGSITATGFTLYWKDDTGATHTSETLNWLALGV
jgi:hypothetical protein